MARIRTIKPELWDNPVLGRCSPLARLTFIGLISLADDEGRGRGEVEAMWGRLHPLGQPATRARFKRALGELEKAIDEKGPLVVFYEADGAAYYWLPGFCRNQRIDEPSRSKFPPPPNSRNVPGTLPDRSALDQGSGIRDQGKEGKGPSPPTPPGVEAKALEQDGKTPDSGGPPPPASTRSFPTPTPGPLVEQADKRAEALGKALQIVKTVEPEPVRVALHEFLGWLESRPEILGKRVHETIFKLANLRESLVADNGIPKDKIFVYALRETMKHDSFSASYVAKVMQNAVMKWREGIFRG